MSPFPLFYLHSPHTHVGKVEASRFLAGVIRYPPQCLAIHNLAVYGSVVAHDISVPGMAGDIHGLGARCETTAIGCKNQSGKMCCRGLVNE